MSLVRLGNIEVAATSSDDLIVIVWNLDERRPLLELRTEHEIVVTPFFRMRGLPHHAWTARFAYTTSGSTNKLELKIAFWFSTVVPSIALPHHVAHQSFFFQEERMDR